MILEPGQTPTLPSEPDDLDPPPELIALRDSFEQVLIELDILQDQSLLVAADELSRALIERSKLLVSRWVPSFERTPSSPRPPRQEPEEKSNVLRGGRALENATGAFANVSKGFVSSLDRWSMRFGKQLSQRLNTTPASESSPKPVDHPSRAGSLNLGVISQASTTFKHGIAESSVFFSGYHYPFIIPLSLAWKET